MPEAFQANAMSVDWTLKLFEMWKGLTLLEEREGDFHRGSSELQLDAK